jgi:MoaA/NifB/PqqE/SkfB family radical SAM enzyme
MALDRDLLSAYNSRRKARASAVVCHAPFTSMNFAQNGDVSVCCYNREYLLGSYPQTTLTRMWSGEAARGLRESMRNEPLPRGCDICATQLESRNFEGLRARFYDRFAGDHGAGVFDDVPPFPKVMEFELSNVCNLECAMCSGFFSSSIRRNRERLPPVQNPYDDTFVSQLEPFIPHLEAARFLGGEPFLIRIYDRIWDLIARLNPAVEVSITTNGTILNQRVKDILEGLNAELIVSIDSLDPQLYEQLRVHATYDAVMANLEYLLNYTKRKGTSLTLAVCPMRWNWRDLPRFVDYCDDRGAQVFFNTVVFPEGATFRSMCREELSEVVQSLRSEVPRQNTALERYNASQYHDVVLQIASELERKPKNRGAEVALTKERWRLVCARSSDAEIAIGTGAADPVRVTVRSLGSNEQWDVKVKQVGLAVASSRGYSVRFRARADGARRAWVGLEHDRDTSTHSLGLYEELELGPRWENFQFDFSPLQDDDDACFFVNLGTSLVAVELADWILEVVDDHGASRQGR